MATSGIGKYNKYFKEGTTTTVNRDLHPMSLDGTPLKTTIATGSTVEVPKSKDYKQFIFGQQIFTKIFFGKKSPKKVGLVPFNSLQKPKMCGGEELGIHSGTLIKYGLQSVHPIDGKDVAVREFTNKTKLSNSIIEGLKSNKIVSRNHPEIIDLMEEYLSGNLTQIDWRVSPTTSNNKHQMGKYLGEVLVGLLGLSNKLKYVSDYNFQNTRVKKFLVPESGNFPGIDSILVLADGKEIPISSKFGVGAKASIFQNIVVPSMGRHLGDSVFYDLIRTIKNLHISPDTVNKYVKMIVYYFGVSKILNVKAPYNSIITLYDNIRDKRRLDPYQKKIIKDISAYPGLPPLIKKNLPLSTTAFFNRELASMLNADMRSIKQMKDILSDKNFQQVNLNIKDWVTEGKVNFSFSASTDTYLRITGSKSAITDVTAQNGTVNYELTSLK